MLAQGRLLVRARIGSGAMVFTESTRIALSADGVTKEDAVCKPRWITWLLPKGTDASKLGITAERPVRVYEIEVYRQKGT